MNSNIYPRSNDFQTIYLNMVIKNPAIIVGDYTIYNDFVNDPVLFEKNNVLYHCECFEFLCDSLMRICYCGELRLLLRQVI